MLKILVVGYGSIGKRHVNNILSNTNSEIIICTKRRDLGHLKKHGIKIYNSLEESLEDKPDIGFIANETNLHIPTALKLANAGLDLFIEKPLSNSMTGIKQLEKLVRKKRLVTMIGCNFRFHPCIKKLKQLVCDNRIGGIISVQAENGSYLPDYHPWEDYETGFTGSSMGGGISVSEIHDLDYLYWIFGDIKEVLSITGKFSHLKTRTNDLSLSIIKFRNNIVGQLYLDWFQRPAFRRCKIKGTKGTLYWDSNSNEVKIFNSKGSKWKSILKVKTNYLDYYQKNPMYVDEIKHFLNCIRNRKKTINDLRDGVRTLQISLSIEKASKLNRVVKL